MSFEEDTYTSIFSSLKHPVRRKILRMLGDAPMSYTEMLNGLGVETGFLNYHLENLSGLITKGGDGKYGLSKFGEVSLGIIEGVEEPVKRRAREIRFLGLWINPTILILVVAAFLIASNSYWAYAYNSISRENANALGEALIQARGFLGESVSLMDFSIEEGRIDAELLELLYRDTIQLSRQLKFVMSLDGRHGAQWSQIRASTDSLVDFLGDLVAGMNKLMLTEGRAHMEVGEERSLHLGRIRDSLKIIERKAFPPVVVIGSNPRVRIEDGEITEAMEASLSLQSDINSARGAFDLGAGLAPTYMPEYSVQP